MGPAAHSDGAVPRSRTVATAVLLVLAVAIVLWQATPAPAASVLSFTPEADTYVDAEQPATSFGALNSAYVDGKPTKVGFLRFRVTGANGRRVVSARLRLHQRDWSEDGGRVSVISDTSWSEAITWQTRPAIDGPQLGSFGAVSAGNSYEIDLADAVTGDGVVSLALSSIDSDGVRWSTREYSSAPPQLILEVDAGATDNGLSQVAAATIGSSDPTYYSTQKRIAVTRGGRLLTVYGRHATGVQLAWRGTGEPTWSTASTGRVGNGLLLESAATGDLPASIAIESDSLGAEHAWVVWAGELPTSGRLLQLVRLSDLDAPSGPSVGPIATLEAASPGAYRPDIAFERGADGVTQGVVTWHRKRNDTVFEIVTGWLSDLDVDTPALVDRTVIEASEAYRLGSTLVGGDGVRAVIRNAASYLAIRGHDAGAAPTTWWIGPRGARAAGYPSATRLDGGAILVASETDQNNRVVEVQRFSSGGAPAPVELRVSGYRDPSIATDGSRAWLVMVRMSDGYVVSREYSPATGWHSADRVEIGAEGGGGHRFPNVLRFDEQSLRFVVRGPSGNAFGTSSAVLAAERPL